MPISRATLEAAIKKSGGVQQPNDQVEGLLAKLAYLEATGRYSKLLATFANANNKSNFLAFLLEVSFGYQFEAAGMPLAYEIKQSADNASSIDFKLDAQNGATVFFELRLLQQDQQTAKDIAHQLRANQIYQITKNGRGEQTDILRLQSTILSKVQKRDGTPIKFLISTTGFVNIVVVCVSDILLGMPDKFDCLLAMYGDPEVPEHCQRGIFGLFQEAYPGWPAHIQARATLYAHIRNTLHGVLFVFRPKGSAALAYGLEQVTVWNRALISVDQATPLMAQIIAALPPLK